ncbi:DUF1508 domain-containing protein [uncultured Algibacter sp.]|uniref:YegP family protein n=1 Tax=uncultured Algibacter sp. TaxID=298659 RepID=UPI00260ADD2B|nr:DUF1508 domain-containing protein [uncultured Algibacter sp.]
MTQFKIFRDKLGRYRFLFKPNSELITLTSEPYNSISLCLQNIRFFKKHAFNDSYFVRQKASCGSHYFTFEKLSNSELIATSESFLTFNAMENMITFVKTSAKATKIDDFVYAI